MNVTFTSLGPPGDLGERVRDPRIRESLFGHQLVEHRLDAADHRQIDEGVEPDLNVLLAKLLVDVAALDDLDRIAFAVAVIDDLDALAALRRCS